MRKLLVCQHVAYEILGTLDPLLRSAGYRIRYVNFSRNPDAEPNLDGYDGLILLGGPMNVDDSAHFPHLNTELKLVEQALKRDLAVLGVCLGAQLVAKALGAWVGASATKEIGWYDVSLTRQGASDPVLGHCRPTERIFQWHGQTFEIPNGAVHLASSEACPSQAFRYGENVYGFQFHLEVDEAMIGRWLEVPGHVAEIAALGGAIDPEAIRAETPRHIARLKELSDRTFGRFIGRFGSPKSRFEVLPSR